MLLAAIATGSASAQSLTVTRQDVASYPGARGIVAGDFDRDGWIDLAQANTGRNTVTILINQGGSARSFVAAADLAVGLGPFDLTTADFNRDGIPDLAVANADANSISILRGQASGAFVRTDIAVPAGPRGIATADLNKDGRADLIVTGWDANSLRVLYGTGSGTFTSGPSLAGLPGHPQGIVSADFNRDGRTDLAVASENATGLSVFSGTASGLVLSPIAGASSLNVLATADLNRDGWADVAAASSTGNRVAVFLGSATGLHFNRSYATGSSPRGIVIRDLDYDGMADVILANRSGNSVSVLRGSRAAPGTLLAAQPFAAGAGSRTLAVADFDSDGLFDVATGNQDASSATLLWNATAFAPAAFSYSRLSFGTPGSPVGGSASAVPADFNEDGRLDVVITPDFTVGRLLQVFLSDGPVVPLEIPQYPGGYSAGDFNKDGHADVIVMSNDSNRLQLWIFLGDGQGHFTRTPETRVDVPVYGIGRGDLNGDATPDLVFTSYDRSISSYYLQVMRGAGDGTFALGSRITTSGEFNSAPTIVDVTRDGKADVALLVRGALSVYRGDGAGNLTPFGAWEIAPYVIQNFVLADLNHDGRLDVVAGEQSRVRVALGTSSGFAASNTIALEGYSNWDTLAVADINLDGDPDVIGSAGYILAGRGDGTFGAQQRFLWDSQLLFVADFTRDGLPDVIVPTANGSFDVLANRRNGVNHAPTVDAGPDVDIEYTRLFWEEPPSLFATARDDDQHWLTYEWRDENGKVIGYDGPYLPLDYFMSDPPPHEPPSHGPHTFTVRVTDGRGGTATDSVRVTIVPTREIVLWAASGFYEGTFEEVDDPTAAGDIRGHDKNLGRPKVTTPVAAPANSIRLGFIADPTQTYKLWIRLKADGNNWGNDSVWVQFTGSTDAQGNPKYQTGTASGLEVNLEECSGCGVSGWGWEDDGWGAVNRNGVTVRFPEGGFQSIVIQTREDGVSIDQVVLSSDKYLTTRPGTSKNDTTILQFTYWQMEG
jgi:hypothetical protein